MDKNRPEERKESTLGDAMQRQIEEHIRQYTSKSELHRVETQKGTDGNEIERLREAFDMVKANRPLPHFPAIPDDFNPEIEKYPDSNGSKTKAVVASPKDDPERLSLGTNRNGIHSDQNQQMSFDFGEGQQS